LKEDYAIYHRFVNNLIETAIEIDFLFDSEYTNEKGEKRLCLNWKKDLG